MSLATHCRDLVTLECAGLHHLTGTHTLTTHYVGKQVLLFLRITAAIDIYIITWW